MSRHGFTLIESVVVVVVLAMLVPVSVIMLRDATAARVDAVDVIRASWLANGAVDQVIADATAGSADIIGSPEYETDLRDRLRPLTSVYADRGFAWTFDTAAPVSADGAATGDPDRDVYVPVTVGVSWSSPYRGPRSLSVSALVAETTP